MNDDLHHDDSSLLADQVIMLFPGFWWLVCEVNWAAAGPKTPIALIQIYPSAQRGASASTLLVLHPDTFPPTSPCGRLSVPAILVCGSQRCGCAVFAVALRLPWMPPAVPVVYSSPDTWRRPLPVGVYPPVVDGRHVTECWKVWLFGGFSMPRPPSAGSTCSETTVCCVTRFSCSGGAVHPGPLGAWALACSSCSLDLGCRARALSLRVARPCSCSCWILWLHVV